MKKKIINQLINIINSIRPVPKNNIKKPELFNYLEGGHLDSMELIKFNLLVEKKFKIKILSRDINKKNFGTLKVLADIIEKKLVN